MNVFFFAFSYKFEKFSAFNAENYQLLAAGAKNTGGVKWGYPRQIGKERYNKPEEKCMVLHPGLDCEVTCMNRVILKVCAICNVRKTKNIIFVVVSIKF